MAPARVEKIITGIDVGSSKVTALIAGQTADGALIVLGSGVREAQEFPSCASGCRATTSARERRAAAMSPFIPGGSTWLIR